MTQTIQPGMWVRWTRSEDHAPIAGWRLLVDVVEAGWPRWTVYLSFADGLTIPWHRDNLALADEHGRPLWETSSTKPAEVPQ